mmetsp:Transcript_13608/g.19910  ORF Transcript_13608/g.19910 Transcript_13608/m.19910 type:complete len:101 (-) Transcript_13608:2-304(-)
MSSSEIEEGREDTDCTADSEICCFSTVPNNFMVVRQDERKSTDSTVDSPFCFCTRFSAFATMIVLDASSCPRPSACITRKTCHAQMKVFKVSCQIVGGKK